MEVKNTLKMPKTNFEMRGNLNIKEPVLVKKWIEDGLYHKMNEGKDLSFILHDGPPYANGPIHCGHMMNRILKDFTIRFNNMCGYKTPFWFGWDTHGLPIENMVIKSGVNRKTTPVAEFRQKCREYALKQVSNQKEQMLRLGTLCDIEKPYLTLLKEYEANQIRLFADMALKGYIYKGLKPVYWSPSSESALAEAEIEYADVLSHSIYVAFNVLDGKGVLREDERVLIWTTTPWTLPANLAVSAHPDFTYGVFETNKGKLVFLKSFEEKLKEELELEYTKLIREINGKQLEYVSLKHPFYDRQSLLIVGEHVTDDAGTGFVHTAPGHGVEDYNVCKNYNIKPYCPVDSRGYMMAGTGEGIEGLFYEDANKAVLEIIQNNGSLIKHKTFTHSYPHDWRTNKPLIFRATDQWFCSIDPIREKLIEEIHNVKWYPSWGEQRMVNMIKDRADWCISRQRIWGVPLPIIYNEDGTPIIEKEVFENIANIFEKEGSDVWYIKDAKEFLPAGYKNEHSPNGEYTKEKDIMDVWFDSGSSFSSALENRGYDSQADLYLEGSDQYRGWFNSSLIISVATKGKAPYKSVVSHGWVVDENWEKMSKSKGNGIDPSKIANMFGADILRLWASTIDYQQDVRISESIIKQVSEVYRKIRNTFKFLLGNLETYKPDNKVSYQLVDKFILNRLAKVTNTVIEAFRKYDFATGMSAIVTFMSTDLSSFYLSITKDVLYCGEENDRRNAIVNVYYIAADTLLRLLTPILPFTMEEVNNNMPLKEKESAQLLSYPTIKEYDPEIEEQYQTFLLLRDDILKGIEKARNEGIIRSEQESLVSIEILNDKVKELYDKIKDEDVEKLFVVSEVKCVGNLDVETYNVSKVKVEHHPGVKCDRCWNYTSDTEVVDETTLCARCRKVLGL